MPCTKQESKQKRQRGRERERVPKALFHRNRGNGGGPGPGSTCRLFPNGGRKVGRERERLAILAQARQRRTRPSHSHPATRGHSSLLSFSFLATESGRSQPNPGSCSCASRSASAISGGYLKGICAHFEVRDRESDIGAVGSGRDQQPTAGSPGSLTTGTTTQSANLQADYRVAARLVPRTGTTTPT